MSLPFNRILIMAGGTGGHIFPGLAVARYLREKGVDVHWLGTSQGMESRWVPQAQIPFHVITINGLRGKGIKALLKAPWLVSKAIVQAKNIMRQVKPDVVLGMGGFASGPGGVASWLMRYPLVIHEQNTKSGFTNKMLAFLSNKILEGFPATFQSSSKVVTVGNPVREAIENLPPPQDRLYPFRSPFRLLVLGGSLGAQALNEVVPRTLAQIPVEERPEVIHQTGQKHFEAAQKAYEKACVNVQLVQFIEDMSSAYAWADIVLCRAGALTVAELCAAGLGAIFIPFPFAVDDHQTLNAQWMVKQDAALCIQQKELTPERLAATLSDFSRYPENRLKMAQAAYQLRYTRVSEKIFDILCAVVRR